MSVKANSKSTSAGKRTQAKANKAETEQKSSDELFTEEVHRCCRALDKAHSMAAILYDGKAVTAALVTLAAMAAADSDGERNGSYAYDKFTEIYKDCLKSKQSPRAAAKKK